MILGEHCEAGAQLCQALHKGKIFWIIVISWNHTYESKSISTCEIITFKKTMHWKQVDDTKCKTVFKNSISTSMETQVGLRPKSRQGFSVFNRYGFSTTFLILSAFPLLTQTATPLLKRRTSKAIFCSNQEFICKVLRMATVPSTALSNSFFSANSFWCRQECKTINDVECRIVNLDSGSRKICQVVSYFIVFI